MMRYTLIKIGKKYLEVKEEMICPPSPNRVHPASCLRHSAQIQPNSLTSDTLGTLSEMPAVALEKFLNMNTYTSIQVNKREIDDQ